MAISGKKTIRRINGAVSIAVTVAFLFHPLADSLQVQSALNPIENMELLHKILIEASLKYILENENIESINLRYVSPIDNLGGARVSLDFSPPEEGKKYGKLKIDDKWHVPCFVADKKNKETRYGVVIRADGIVESISLEKGRVDKTGTSEFEESQEVLNASPELASEQKAKEEMLLKIERIFARHNLSFERVRKIFDIANRLYLTSQDRLAKKRTYYHTMSHGVEAALFIAEAFEEEGLNGTNETHTLEIATIAALVHDAGYWRKDWWKYIAEHEEEAKRFVETAVEAKGLVSKEEAGSIKDLIEYTKFFGKENTPEAIESRVGLSGKMKLAGKFLAIGDTLIVYGGTDMVEKCKALYKELEIKGKSRNLKLYSEGAFYTSLYDFVKEQIEPRNLAFKDAYAKPYFKQHRDNFARNKEILSAFAESYKFSENDGGKSKMVFYPGYFKDITPSNLDVIRKSIKTFGKVLIVVLPKGEETSFSEKARELASRLTGDITKDRRVKIVSLNSSRLIGELARICSVNVMVRRLQTVLSAEKLDTEADYARKNYEKYGLETYFIPPKNEQVTINKELLEPYQKELAKMLKIPIEDADMTSPKFKERISAYNAQRNAPTDLLVSDDTVLYSGSFDPVTEGHMEVIERLSGYYKKIYVGIGVNPNKQYMFTREERVNFTKEAVLSRGLSNVEVVSYEGLTVDCARRLGAGVLVRGARSVKDLKEELPLKYANEILDGGLPTLLVLPYKCADVNSSFVKDKIRKKEGVAELVPRNVHRKLQEKGLVAQDQSSSLLEGMREVPYSEKNEEKYPESAQKSAAVILLKKEGGKYSVLLTKRSEKLKYGGQWVFPGGEKDPQEELADTAARELKEETNIPIRPIDILGRAAMTLTEDSQHAIHPFIAIAQEKFEYKRSPEVVDETWISLEDFFKDEIPGLPKIGPANKKIMASMSRLICKALAVEIYGREVSNIDETRADELYEAIKQRPELLTQILGYLETEKIL